MSAVVQVTKAGEEHGLINTMPNSVPFNDFKNCEPALKEKLRKQKKEDSKLVRARYINHREGPTGRWSNTYCKYAGDPLQQWHLIHDHEYLVPYGLVKQINETARPQRAGLLSIDGKDVTNSGEPLKSDRMFKEHEMVPVSFN